MKDYTKEENILKHYTAGNDLDEIYKMDWNTGEVVELMRAATAKDVSATEEKQIELPELTEDNKALLIIGFLELTAQYAEELMQTGRFDKLFVQKLKFHTNGMIKNYDKVINEIMRDGDKASLGDELVVIATVIENSIRACVNWGDKKDGLES